ncbi:hypothetical protein BN1723_002244 [Verticillium longisporum]|uniref:Uncharacterized protein n=1 Tax=Verticillium longisporum TaxID=100787 RepID=A0A0G4L233_VERLO|nr:hypothetical protein BN1723_002244 [Verticillium longisporum]
MANGHGNAPGHEAPRDAYCTSCGASDHFAMYCYLDKSQAASSNSNKQPSSGHSGHNSSKDGGNRRRQGSQRPGQPSSSGGMIVTRYAPQPGHPSLGPPPPPPSYSGPPAIVPSWPQPGPYGAPPPPPPVAHHGPPAPYPGFYPPPPPPHQYGGPPPPPGPVGLPGYYGASGSPGPPPPPGPHAPPAHYGPYGSAPSYPSQPYQSPGNYGDPYRPPPNTYDRPSDGYDRPPDGYDRPPTGYDRPAPPYDRPPSGPGFHHPPPSLPPIPPAPSSSGFANHSPPPPYGQSGRRSQDSTTAQPPRNQRFRDKDRHGRGRNRKNQHHADDRRDRDRQKHEKQMPRERDPSSQPSNPTERPSIKGSPYARPVSAFREHGVENERDWDQNHAAGFREPPEPRVSDALRSPLPRPAEFDQLAKPSQAQGAMPVREIPQFDSMRDDPDFRSKWQPSKPQREARLSPKQPGVLAKAASPPPPATPLRKWKTPAEILAGPSPAILKAAEERNSNRKRPHDDTRRQDEGGRRQDKETLRRESHQKRPRFDHGDFLDSNRSTSRPETDQGLKPRPSSSNDHDRPTRSPHRSWERPFEQSPRGRDRRERSFRDDSAGDIEGRRSRSRDSYHRDSDRPFLPLPADAGTPPPQSRTSSRRSSFASQVGEARQRRSMSRASFVSSGTHESDLSSVGAELLGLPSKAKEEKERDDSRKRNMNRIKKRTVPKVDNVYSRRW